MICQTCQREIAEYSNFCYYCGSRQSAAPRPSPISSKRLMRSATDVKIAGVCGGVAEYFEVDPTVVRLVWVLLCLLPVPVVPAFLGYIVAWIVMPKAPVPTVAAAQPATTQAAQPH
jgi:phage shock protein C